MNKHLRHAIIGALFGSALLFLISSNTDWVVVGLIPGAIGGILGGGLLSGFEDILPPNLGGIAGAVLGTLVIVFCCYWFYFLFLYR